MLSGAKPIAARHMAVLEELARRLPDIAKISLVMSDRLEIPSLY